MGLTASGWARRLSLASSGPIRVSDVHATTANHRKGARHLNAAKAARNDEFYTQWADIEREMNAYVESDPDVFRDKVILLPCDDPEWSNFTKFFALHFVDYGIKKLISTSYAPDRQPSWETLYADAVRDERTHRFDATKTRANGKKFVLEAEGHQRRWTLSTSMTCSGTTSAGDGDFRSDQEVKALGDGADIVITNPPFSLSREFDTPGWSRPIRGSLCSQQPAPSPIERSSRCSSCSPDGGGRDANATDMAVWGLRKARR